MISQECYELNNKKYPMQDMEVNGKKQQFYFFMDLQVRKIIFQIQKNCLIHALFLLIDQGLGNRIYTMEEFFIGVNTVLEHHGVKKVHLIGHSAGGYYAQVYAQNNPDKVEALSLVSSMVPYNCQETKSIINSEIKRNNFLSLHLKAISKYFFKKAAQGITKNFDSQFEGMLKTVSNKERTYINDNYELVKNAIISAVKNDGKGIYYDAYALCQKRDKVCINCSIPVFIWNGAKDDTTPVSYAEYLAKKYDAKEIHIIDDVGHMMYLLYWKEIVLETLNI